MSAFILSDKHFQIIADYIVSIISNKSEGRVNLSLQDFANKLKKINIDSVNFRYNEKTRFSKVKLNPEFSFIRYNKSDIIRLIQCWIYQSCENESHIEYQIMKGYLMSLFSENEIKSADNDSTLWSI